MEAANVRNLEQIQEQDTRSGPTRLATLLLAAAGGAALVTVAVTMTVRKGSPTDAQTEPLAALVVSAQAEPEADAANLEGKDVTFPQLLSDNPQPTTALAAVKDAQGRLVEQTTALPPGALTTAPPATDRLPVVPLPAGTLLNSTSVTTQPKDELTAMASAAAQVPDDPQAPPGADRGFQIQVASFKQQQDADALVAELRKRGHSAFRQAAYVPDRGLWHRVRIGPFDNRYQANQYRQKFEATERMSPFVVDPQQVKMRAEMREAKLAARRRQDKDQH